MPPKAMAPLPDPWARTMHRKALRMFLSATPDIRGTPVVAYLAGRGIDLSELGRCPRSLRFHPALWNREINRASSAMIAAVTNAAGQLVAVHRTWLDQRGDGQWVKAPLRQPKMSLGPVRGGAILLWRGASRKPLAKAPADDELAIGEGIETCLSVVVACPHMRVMSSVSLANMASIVLPDAIRSVTLLKDEDGDNEQAERGFRQAVARFQSEGRVVRIARPPVGKDFNDTLQAGDIE